MAIGVLSTGADPGWVDSRTGVLERRYAAPGTTTSDLALPAATEALNGHPAAWENVRAVIVATTTPDVPQPSTAAILQAKLGLSGVPCFDLNAVCSGFLFATTVAESMLRSRYRSGCVLVVGADMFSRIMDRSDRRTVSLFGDGAGAVVLGRVPAGYGLRTIELVTDGRHHDYVYVESGGTRRPTDEAGLRRGDHFFRMDGRAVREYAMRTLCRLTLDTLGSEGLAITDIDRFVFHQANIRLLEGYAEAVGAPVDRFEFTAPRFGNMAAASLPVTLHSAHQRRPFVRGDRILLATVGGGMTAGMGVLTWF
jgi:3-oxoacyl-(acyl-carrier-protein) synthase III